MPGSSIDVFGALNHFKHWRYMNENDIADGFPTGIFLH